MEGLLKQFRIGVIEDDQDDFILVRDLLSSANYQLDWYPTYETGREALLLQEHDLFLIDFNLGSRNGLDLLEEISHVEVKKPMILMTGQENAQIDVRAMERGVSNFLPKQVVTLELLERSIRYCLKVNQDFQNYKALEAEKAERRATEKWIEQRTQFLARITHEIRSPLSAIMGYADLAIRSQSIKGKDEAVAVILRHGNQLLTLIDDFLTESKVRNSEFQINPASLDYRKMIRETIELYEPLSAKRGVALSATIGEGPDRVLQDQERLRQILNNLVSNAIKATKAGEIVLSCEFQSPDSLTLQVSDTGRGIAREHWERIFDPFFQIPGSGPGTGLGLSVSRQLARLMGGDLFVSESSAKGSIFVCRVAAPAIRAEPSYRVLVVDDSLDLQFLNRSILEEAGITVAVADDGVQALAKLAQEKFDLVLMDQEMPDLDGLKATAQARSQGYKMPIVLMTAHDTSFDQLAPSGVTDVLRKPVSRQQLLAKVVSHCQTQESLGSSSLAPTKPYSLSLR